MSGSRTAFASCLAIIVFGLASGPVAAQSSGSPSSVYRDQGGLIRAGESIAALGADGFGDSINPYDGALSFRHVDVSLPGNSALPVGVVRRLTPRDSKITSAAFGDGSPGVTRSYTADGLLYQLISGGSTWTYGYNNRRLLTSESLTLSLTGASYVAGWGIDAYGRAGSLSYPGGPTVSYARNALGEATQVSGFASGVSYHPNGAIAGYTLANGIAHSTTQTLRGQPLLWRDAGVIQDSYAYDANGSVTSITDQQENLTSRSLGYDGLDRLTSASGIWGAGVYGYDGLDNLRSSTVGGRTLTHNYDASNRLVSLSGSQSLAYGYDARGNLTSRGSQGYSFDIGNRMLSAPGKASYGYDGHGRRTWVSYADGSWKVQFYSLSGELLYSKHSSQGETRHIGLGRRLLAEQNSASGVRYAHTDALGSPVAWTNASGQLITRTRYEPYGGTAAGTNPTGIGYTGHVNDADTGLIYMQQRYYDPLAGRFLSVDPVVSDPESGKGFALYAYVDDSPYSRVDPDGRSPLDLMFLAADLYKFGEAVATGGNIGAAGIDLAASIIGAASPLPGVGEALKIAKSVDKVADTIKAGEKLVEAAADVGKAVRSGTRYSDDLVKAAQKEFPGKAGRIERHHITPEYLGGARSGPKVPLDAAYHQQITNEFRRLNPYGSEVPSPARVQEIMRQVYDKYPLPPGY